MAMLLSSAKDYFAKASSGDFKDTEHGNNYDSYADIWFAQHPKPRMLKKRKRLPHTEESRKDFLYCPEVALAHWNKLQKASGEPQYVLVKPKKSTPFFHRSSWWFHTNFQAKIKDDPAAEPEMFFAEVKRSYHAKKKDKVTKVCVLLPTDQGLYDCKACVRSRARHPESRGFHVGQLMCTVNPYIPRNVKKVKAETGELKAKEQCVASRTRSRSTLSSSNVVSTSSS